GAAAEFGELGQNLGVFHRMRVGTPVGSRFWPASPSTVRPPVECSPGGLVPITLTVRKAATRGRAQRDRRWAGQPVNWTGVVALVLLGAIYFPTALWLEGNYVPPRFGPASVSDAKLILKLERPFVPYGRHAFWAKAPDLQSMADTTEEPERSPAQLYE